MPAHAWRLWAGRREAGARGPQALPHLCGRTAWSRMQALTCIPNSTTPASRLLPSILRPVCARSRLPSPLPPDCLPEPTPTPTTPRRAHTPPARPLRADAAGRVLPLPRGGAAGRQGILPGGPPALHRHVLGRRWDGERVVVS